MRLSEFTDTDFLSSRQPLKTKCLTFHVSRVTKQSIYLVKKGNYFTDLSSRKNCDVQMPYSYIQSEVSQIPNNKLETTFEKVLSLWITVVKSKSQIVSIFWESCHKN